jgi:DNA-directed RNA polymerase specialized sigma24 family protein
MKNIKAQTQDNMPWSVEEWLAACRERASLQSTRANGYAPSSSQLAFFGFMWLSKKSGFAYSHLNQPIEEDVTILQSRLKTLDRYLEEWGGAVTQLREKNEQEWEVLRRQIEASLWGWTHPQHGCDDVVQDALTRLWMALSQLYDWRILENLSDSQGTMDMVLSSQDRLSGLYGFQSPLYAYAKKITRNVHRTKMRDRQHKEHSLFSEENLSRLNHVQGPEETDAFIQEDLFEQWRLRLTTELTNLLRVIQRQLTEKQQAVVLHTLACRPQFWQAVEMTGVAVPAIMPPQTGRMTDRELGEALDMQDNSVRVHRNNAKQRIAAVDLFQGELLTILMNRGLGR